MDSRFFRGPLRGLVSRQTGHLPPSKPKYVEHKYSRLHTGTCTCMVHECTHANKYSHSCTPYSTRVNKIIVNRLLKSRVNRLLKNLPVDNVVLIKAPTLATLAPAAATNEQPKQEKTARSTFTWSTAKLEVKEYLTFKASRGTRKHGFGQKQFAKDRGYSQGTLSKWCRWISHLEGNQACLKHTSCLRLITPCCSQAS